MEATSSKLGRRSVIRLIYTDNLYAIIEEKSKETSTVRFYHPASSVKIGHYTVPLPDTARIVSGWTSLCAAVMERLCAPLVKKHSGWVVEEEGVVMVACDKEMSRQCDECPEQLEFITEEVAELLRTGEG
jgi:hypothetical protein